MQKVSSYKDLRVWQQAIDLVPAVYKLVRAERLGYVTRKDLEVIEAQMTELRMPLQGLINRLQSKL